MSDSGLAVTPGSGATIDCRTEGTNNELRQVVVVGDPATNAAVAAVQNTAVAGTEYGVVARTIPSGTQTVDSELPAAVTLADAASAAPTTPTVGSVPLIMNATTIDRQRAVVNGLNSVGTGIVASGTVAQFDDTVPGTITENSFGPVRMSVRREVYNQIRDAAGNERGLNIDTNGALAATVTNATEANLKAQTGGTIAHDGTDSGNPVKIGGKATTQLTIPAPVSTTLDRTDAWYDMYGATMTRTAYRPTYRWATPSVTVISASTGNPCIPFFTIYGTSARNVIVQRIVVSGPTLTAVEYNSLVIGKLSAVAAGGTTSAYTPLAVDANSPAPLATPVVFTASGTASTLMARIASRRREFQATTAVNSAMPEETVFDFRTQGDNSGIILRTATQGIGMFFGAAAGSNVTLSLEVEWCEE